MTVILNDPGLVVLGGNTGAPAQEFHPGLITGMMLVDKDKTFTITTVATFITDVQALCLAGLSTRAYPIYGIVALEPKTAEISVIEKGYGGEQFGPDPKYKFLFELGAGGLFYQNQLAEFNNDHSKRVIFFDNKNNVYGVKTGDTTMKGVGIENFKVYQVDWPSAKDKPPTYRLYIGLSDPADLNANIAVFNLGTSPESNFQGLQNIEMYDLGAGSATKKQVIGIRTILDKQSLYGAFSATLVSAFATIFTATLGGAAANPVAAVGKPLAGVRTPPEGGVELEFGATGVHIITMANPATLSATPNFIGVAPDNGFECLNTLSVTVA